MTQAGWHPDPTGRFPHRYWDGTRWTDHVGGPQGQAIDPLPPSPQQPQQQQPQQGQFEQRGQFEQHGEFEQPRNDGRPDDGDRELTGLVRADPQQLQAVMSELGVAPLPLGNGTPFGEPILILAHSSTADALEWWTPAGTLVAVATNIEPTQAEIEEHGTATDPATGDMVGSRYLISDGKGQPIARTIRTLKPAKPPLYIDDPSGNRIATAKSEKLFTTIASYTITTPDGTELGKFEAPDRHATTVSLFNTTDAQLATVVKYQKWGAADYVKSMQRNRPFQTPGAWLANRLMEAIDPIERAQICNVLVVPQPLPQPYGLLAFLAPLILEQQMSMI